LKKYPLTTKIELFSGDAASPPFREWFPKFDRYAQAHGIPVEMRGEALCFALEGPALEFVTNSGWCNQTKNYQLLAQALNHEFPTLTPAAYATQLHQAKQFPDEQIAQFIRRVQRLIYQAYPGIQPVLASQMAVTAVRNGCMVRYRPVLDPMGPELGIEHIKNTLINYEQNRGFDYIKQGFNRANNGQKYNQQPGIMALQAAQGNTPEENEKSVLEDALLSEDEPLTMYQVRQVIKENTSAMAKETTKAVAEANKQLESTVKEIRKQVDELKPSGKGNGNGQGGQKGGFKPKGNGNGFKGGNGNGAPKQNGNQKGGKPQFDPATINGDQRLYPSGLFPYRNSRNISQCRRCGATDHYMRQCKLPYQPAQQAAPPQQQQQYAPPPQQQQFQQQYPPQPAAAAYPVQGSYAPQQQYPYQGAPVYYDPYAQQQAFQTFDMGAPGAVQCMSLWGEIQFEDSEEEIEEEIGETTEKECPSPKSVKSGNLGILAILKWALYALLFVFLVPGVGAVTPRPTVHPNRLYS
jgi:hypothetical protein